ncbi:helix-turn-helix domain-containing protein|uniref:helix-turn-helix domain-containing protein n=1 Tax=Pseudomonas sp. SbOxS1 TaxID=2723884 RepID=UPI0015D3889A|nr:helix-turn-helix domain-containing protein [Pseudomonas sp. SbOxS1]
MSSTTFETTSFLLSPNSVAKALDISRSSVYALMRNGDLAWIPFGSDRRIHISEVQRLATEGIPTTVKRGE